MRPKLYLGNDTIAAIATPLGIGAIGILRLSGPKSIEITASLVTLKNAAPLTSLPAQKSALATFHQNGTRIDQVLVTLFRAPCSYTGEDLVEISCHSGPAILKQILSLLIKAGARLAEAGEFSQRAFLNGKLDLAQAEAVADLIHAQTELARAAALSQLEGTLSREILELRDTLIEMLAHIEVGIDHSDDPTVGSAMPIAEMEKNLRWVADKVRRLIQSYEFGRVVREGPKIAILGKPNVGKSSLLNLLLKNDRAIVSATPGTTRDTLEEGFDLLGLKAVLVDTAGVRQNVTDPIERLGIERTQKAVGEADAVLILLDASETISEEDRQMIALVQNGKKGVIALNKNDLPIQLDIQEVLRQFPQFPVVSISALKNTGIIELLQKLYGAVCSISGQGLNSLAKELLVTSLRQSECLVESEKSLMEAMAICAENDMEECLALEIRNALDSLGEIVGETVTEDVLKEIFSKFCIGK